MCITMIKSLRRFFYSVARLPRSHGFGVQSPFAFNFVTKVVRDTKYHDFYTSLDSNCSASTLRLNKFYLRLLDFLKAQECFDVVYIIEGIHSSKQSNELWESIILSSKVVVSFDLYDCGVVFVDGNMPKFNYKVMLV